MAYKYSPYPSFRYHPTLAARVVKTEEEDTALSATDDSWNDTPYDKNFPDGNPELAVQDIPEKEKIRASGKLEHNPTEHELEVSEEELEAEAARKRRESAKIAKDAVKLSKKAEAKKGK